MRRVLVFVKSPVPGRVKTRLGADVGAETAAAIYRVCAEWTMQRLAPLGAEVVVCVDPPEALASVRAWLGAGVAWPQEGRHLCERLQRATARAFIEGARQVLVIGSDSPWLSVAHLEAAWKVLECSDVVLGPCTDGGYYLVGLTRPHAALFEGIDWNASSVLERTIAAAHGLALRVSVLPIGFDVDTMADIQQVVDASRSDHTLAALAARLEALGREGIACRS